MPFEFIVVYDVVFIGFGLCGVVVSVFVCWGCFVYCFFGVGHDELGSGFVVAAWGVFEGEFVEEDKAKEDNVRVI